jgi:hypothetical protein
MEPICSQESLEVFNYSPRLVVLTDLMQGLEQRINPFRSQRSRSVAPLLCLSHIERIDPPHMSAIRRLLRKMHAVMRGLAAPGLGQGKQEERLINGINIQGHDACRTL